MSYLDIFRKIEFSIKASEEKLKKQRKEAWQRYEKHNKRIYITVPIDDYKKLEKHAKNNGRSVARQIYKESKSYRRVQFLAPEQIEIKINMLMLEVVRIGTNINQITHNTNYFGKLSLEKDLLGEFEQLKMMVEDFVKRPWLKAKK